MTDHTTAERATTGLTLTVAHHRDNEFYELGDITHEMTPQQLWDFLVADPGTECCRAVDSHHDLCWLVDQRIDLGLGDSREITAERAGQLLGRDPWTALKEARADLRDFYASMKGRSA